MECEGFILASDWRDGDEEFVSETFYLTHDKEYDHIEMSVSGRILTFDADQAAAFIEAFQNMFDRLGCVGNGDKDK